MKKFKLFVLSSFLAFAAGAQAQGVKCMSAEDVIFAEGENDADLVVSIDYVTSEEIVAWSVSVMLPEGVAFKTEVEDGEEFYVGEFSKDTNAKALAAKMFTVVPRTDGGYLINGYADGNPKMKSTSGELFTATLTATATVDGIGKLYNTSLSKKGDISVDQGNLADAEFAVKGGSGQGINDIKVDAAAGKVYNVSGQQVAAPTKGLYIQNGKKVIVK